MIEGNDNTAVIQVLEFPYQAGDYVHLLAKIVEVDPETNAYTVVLYDHESSYPVVVRGNLIVQVVPVPTPTEPHSDSALAVDKNNISWRARGTGAVRSWYTANDVLGETWENLFRKYGPLHIYELRAVTDNPNGGNA